MELCLKPLFSDDVETSVAFLLKKIPVINMSSGSCYVYSFSKDQDAKERGEMG